MLLSPILNAFIEKNNRKTVLLFTLLFVALAFWFDCVLQKEEVGFGHGYSTLHFCLIYMVGRTVALYKEEMKVLPKWQWLGMYLLCAACVFGLYILNVPFALFYTNPFVILSTVCLFMPFVLEDFHNRVINWLASGCFAVYIIQVIEPAYSWLCQTDLALLAQNPYPLYLVKGFLAILAFVVVCVVYDKIRSWVTKPIDIIVYPKLKYIDEKLKL